MFWWDCYWMTCFCAGKITYGQTLLLPSFMEIHFQGRVGGFKSKYFCKVNNEGKKHKNTSTFLNSIQLR